jgi:hypothetical protein
MKPLLLTLLLIYGCKTSSYFNTPNDAVKRHATLYLTNKDTVPGTLTVTLEDNGHLSSGARYPSFVNFTPEGKDTAQRISLSQIVGYRMSTTFYALKVVDIRMNGVQRLLFLQQLTPDSSKIQLYELHESGQANATGESLTSYYLSLPGFSRLEAINTHGIRIIPEFEEKMSAIVADCPTLAARIRSKEKGYYIPFVSFAAKKHPEVLLRIINEYNHCR